MAPSLPDMKVCLKYAEAAGNITIEQEETEDGFVLSRFVANEEESRDDTLFTEEEINTLHEIANKLGSRSTKEVIERSHQEKAWKKYVENREVINYLEAFEMESI